MIVVRARLLGLGLLLVSGGVALAQGGTMQPGQWEMVSTTRSVDMPNAPPMVAKMMTGRSTTIRHCITAQEAANGAREMMKTNKACTFGRYAIAGGRFDSEMTCTQAGASTTATSTGTYTATTFRSTSHMIVKGPNPMTITSDVTGRRIGGC